jgi:hypothetical protein
VLCAFFTPLPVRHTTYNLVGVCLLSWHLSWLVIDFLSVVGLGLSIVLISVAFERVAKLKYPVQKQ